MMKRIFSKKSGFTLVEILVAFAIFAIMMSMIMQILNLTVARRQDNLNFERELAKQEELLVTTDKNNKYDATGTADGQINLKFSDDLDLSVDFQIQGANSDPSSVDLNYFVGNLDYDAVGIGDDISDNNNNSTGTQMSRYDTRITGIKDLDKIKISVQHTPGSTRYIFTVDVGSKGNMLDEDKQYNQMRLYFYTKKYDSVIDKTETGSDGKTKITSYKKVYQPAKITGFGYYYDGAPTSNYDINKGYKVELSGTPSGGYSAVRISVDKNASAWYGVPYFKEGNTTSFYLDFAEDPQITAKSFGSKATGSDSTATYTAPPILNDDGTQVGTQVNLYGYFDYETSDKPFPGSQTVETLPSDDDSEPST